MTPKKRLPESLAAFIAGVVIVSGLSSFQAAAQEAVPCVPPAESTVVAPAVPEALPQLRLNELLPNPLGDDAQEFIEVWNAGTAAVELVGWAIVDGTGKRFAFAAGALPAQSGRSMLYAETALRLVNTGGHLELIAPDGSVADAVTYASPVPEGQSYARFESSWQWTPVLTPGAANDRGAVVALEPPVPTSTDPVPPVPTTNAPAPAPQPASDLRIVIAALQPNPDGPDDHEWFELRNDGSGSATLDGWRVTDAAGGSFSLAGVTIAAGAKAKFDKTAFKFALNNDAETLRLLDPSGTVRDSVGYEDAPSGATYVRGTGGWEWSSAFHEEVPTEAATSQPTAADTELAAGVTEAQTDATEPDAAEIEVADIESLPDGAAVTVIATVTLPPGVVGKTIFAISDPRSEVGIYARAYGRGALPVLAAGESVRVIGTIHRQNGELAVHTKPSGITRTAAARPLAFAAREIVLLDESDDGLPVTVAGIVAARGKRWITMSDAAATREVTARFMSGEAPAATPGDEVRLNGVVRIKDGVPEIIITNDSAATVTPAAKIESAEAAEPRPALAGRPRLEIPAPTKQVKVGGLAALLALGCTGAALWWRHRRESWAEQALVDR